MYSVNDIVDNSPEFKYLSELMDEQRKKFERNNPPPLENPAQMEAYLQ